MWVWAWVCVGLCVCVGVGGCCHRCAACQVGAASIIKKHAMQAAACCDSAPAAGSHEHQYTTALRLTLRHHARIPPAHLVAQLNLLVRVHSLQLALRYHRGRAWLCVLLGRLVGHAVASAKDERGARESSEGVGGGGEEEVPQACRNHVEAVWGCGIVFFGACGRACIVMQ